MSSEGDAAPRYARFLPYRGQTLAIEGHAAAPRLVAVETNAAPGWPAHLPSPFILIFETPAGVLIPEGLHTLTAADGWRFTLYLMPIHAPEARARGMQAYQAVFN
ncbi:DUF6916 family protein [Acidisphaera rubrifaciens]|uniref:DUF6916 domain-containing protein n=1 Tax=Acidisphaera rubrifaciens HS-AP3 TaxID=1231350 RepID=A0A0D6PCG6_9PROT|nr:hypothetical protein [Acidisphaera rubrifaciens]GAN78554.1 hypothetical protein Asru_1121_03 [Acidisphaera rubrifaciens HS-AP3]